MAAPTNGATFVSQTVPATMVAGQTYSVSVTMKNTGTSTWTAANNYKLGSQNPANNTTWGTARAALTASVAPGAQHTFTYSVTAPTTAGTHNFQWGMLREPAGWFGPTSTNVAVNVTAPPIVDAVTYFHNDIAGTPQLATNASGAVVWKENYLPYGQRQAQAPASTGNKLWYTGKPHEEDTGLTYMGARYYMPLVGRFAGIDPVDIVPEQPHSLNRYAYGNNNPYKFVDPDGRSPVLVWALRGATVLVVAAANSTPEQRAQMALAGERAVQSAVDALGQLRNSVFNESAEGADTPKGQTDTAIDGLTGGLNNETDSKGRPTAGQYVKPGGDAQQDLDALPGTAGSNGQKTLPDGSVAGIHTSTTTGLDTLHVHRPRGSRDIKIWYPE